MRLPDAVLARLRGPALAAVLVGCADPSAVLTSEPTAPPPARAAEVAVLDPVSYDPATESERYARLDQTEARDQQTRDARLADEASDHRAGDASLIGIGSLGDWGLTHINPGCGRG